MSEEPKTTEAPFSLSYENYSGLSDPEGEPVSSYTVTLDSEKMRVAKSVLQGPSGSPGKAIGTFARDLKAEEAEKFLATIRKVRLDTAGKTRSARPRVTLTVYRFKQRAREVEASLTPYDSDTVDQLMPLLLDLTKVYQDLEESPVRAVSLNAEPIWQKGELSFQLTIENVGSETVEIARPRADPSVGGVRHWTGISIAEFQDETDPNPKHQEWHEVPVLTEVEEDEEPTLTLEKGEKVFFKTQKWSAAAEGTKYVMCGIYSAPVMNPKAKEPESFVAGIAKSEYQNFVAGED